MPAAPEPTLRPQAVLESIVVWVLESDIKTVRGDSPKG
jgi:hypothetical protein